MPAPSQPCCFGTSRSCPPNAGVHNSRLLRAYMTFDLLQRPLALACIVKLWARRRNINDSTRDSLSSYAYTLMVIFFLQQRGVLPNLQAPGLLRAYEDWRGAPMPAATVNGFELRYCADDKFLASLAMVSADQRAVVLVGDDKTARGRVGDFVGVKQHGRVNCTPSSAPPTLAMPLAHAPCHSLITQCRAEGEQLSMEGIGSLLLGFFGYYAGVFDWETHAVSVRLGRPRPREDWEACQPRRMGIEDPFEAERDLCATLGKAGTLRGQQRIFKELDRARALLHKGLGGASGAGHTAAVLAELLSDDDL